MSKRILLPQAIEDEAVEMLKEAGCEIVHAPDSKPETVIPLLPGIEGIVLRTGIQITRELLSHTDDLRVISRTGGGFDNVDVKAATEKEIIVTSNVGVNTSSVVEHALALMLALSKQLPLMDRSVRTDQFSVRYQNLPRDLRGQTLGLLGFGRIGSELGRACRQIFHMNVLAYDPFLPEAAKQNSADWVEFVDFKTLLTTSDIISIHMPLTEQTNHMMGADELAVMKPEAILINTSRGPIINEKDLIKALEEKQIAGAGLDVLEWEPPQAESALLKLDNVMMSPHTAALTRECVIRMATDAAACVIDVLAGRQPENVANPHVLDLQRWSHLVRR